jgi:hypothetical protein
MAKLIEVPDDLADLFSNPETIRAAFALLNGLAQMQGQLVPPAASTGLVKGQTIIKGDPPVMTMVLPLQFPNSWAVPTGTFSRTTFVTSSVTLPVLAQKVAALIQDLQSTTMAPTV